MFPTVYGVDFSGAKLAGRNTWVARLEPTAAGPDRPAYRLVALSSLERLAKTAERAPALAHLVRLIAASDAAVWAMDFPFGLPIEVLGPGSKWLGQFDLVRQWGDDAYGLGLECLRRARLLGGPGHIRRLTDSEAKTPFDCYHYRIIYQTFHGMRDVLLPLLRLPRTAILPFQYRRLATARRVLVEACPASTLKRIGLPHRNYKQAQGGPLTVVRRRTRRALVAGLTESVELTPSQRLVLMRNPGGDALDAVIAGLGAVRALSESDHKGIARHHRYPREGRLYV